MTIVCGTDFSQPGQDAVAVAARLSRRRKQDLLLVHAVAPQPQDPMAVDFEPLRSAMAESLERDAAKLRSGGLKVTTRTVVGWPEEEIVRSAREADADLIVLGAFGRHHGPHWIVGSVAERVSQMTPVPLLLVRDPKPIEQWIEHGERLRVLLATDFTPVSDFALDWFRGMMDAGACDVILAYVANPVIDTMRLNLQGPFSRDHLSPIVQELVQRELQKRTSEFLPAGSARAIVKVTMDAAGAEIARTADEEKAGLVVVGSHQRGIIDRMMHGRVSRAVIHASATNVVVVPFHSADERFRVLEAPKIRTILAATDFSACGNHAVAWAMAIAPPASKVFICHVAADAGASRRASGELAQIEHPRSWPDNVEIAVKVASSGSVAKEIWAQAQICDADVVVVGGHGETGVRAILGTVARELLAISTKPVLVVREETGA
ncbi:MAG: universal stress protein [Thermoanaerobaculia bacterium]